MRGLNEYAHKTNFRLDQVDTNMLDDVVNYENTKKSKAGILFLVKDAQELDAYNPAS